MANQKGTKWVVGLSSVALFTALIGFTNKNSDTHFAPSNSVASDQTNQTSAQDELTNQWMNSAQNDTNSSAANDSSSTSQGRSSRPLRTQAS
jgi:hypothetical protein